MMTDSVVLSIIGGLILLLLGVAGFFIKRWMDTTEEMDTRNNQLVEKTNRALQELNLTMTNINGNLIAYQIKMDATVQNVKENIQMHKETYLRDKKQIDKTINEHDSDIQDHTIRITVLERSKI